MHDAPDAARAALNATCTGRIVITDEDHRTSLEAFCEGSLVAVPRWAAELAYEATRWDSHHPTSEPAAPPTHSAPPSPLRSRTMPSVPAKPTTVTITAAQARTALIALAATGHDANADYYGETDAVYVNSPACLPCTLSRYLRRHLLCNECTDTAKETTSDA